ncbi:MAG: hypothetical protein WA001_04010 [Patescibacteria group bacterium]
MKKILLVAVALASFGAGCGTTQTPPPPVNVPTAPTQQTGCTTNSDCQNGASCMVEGPLIANQPVHRVCVPKGEAVPL